MYNHSSRQRGVTMFCPKCGHEIPEDSAFCMECGAKLEQYGVGIEAVEQAEPAAEKEKTDGRSETRLRQAKSFLDRDDNPYDFPPAKQKSKFPVIIAIVAVIVVLLVVALFVFKDKLFDRKQKDAYVFLTYKGYQYMTKPEEDEYAKLLSTDEGSMDITGAVRFSPEGKYLYILTDYDSNDFSGKLQRAECSRLSASSGDNEDEFEIVISDIRITPPASRSNTTVAYDFVSEDQIVYTDSKSNLYFYDGKEKERIEKNVASYSLEDEHYVICSVYDDNSSDYTVYGVDLDHLDDVKTIAEGTGYPSVYGKNDIILSSTADSFDSNDYFDSYFSKYEQAGLDTKTTGISEQAALLLVCQDGAKKIFAESNGQEVCLIDYLDEDAKDELTYDAYELLEKPKLLTTLFSWDGSKKNVIAQDVVFYQNLENGVIYTTKENLSGALLTGRDLTDEISGNAYGVAGRMFFNMDASIYLAEKDKTLAVTGKAADRLKELECDRSGLYSRLKVAGDDVYMNEEDGRLSIAKISGSSIDRFEQLANDAFIAEVEDDGTIYYSADEHKSNEIGYSDLYSCKQGNPVLLAEDVLSGGNVVIGENGTIVGATGRDEDYYYELSVFGKKANGTEIADKAQRFMLNENSDVMYISDGDLYIYKDGKKTRLANSVVSYWEKNEPENTWIYINRYLDEAWD